MREAGYTDVHNLRGGIVAWTKADQPIVTGD
jgi:rhodanese-related sulfurtransferase